MMMEYLTISAGIFFLMQFIVLAAEGHVIRIVREQNEIVAAVEVERRAVFGTIGGIHRAAVHNRGRKPLVPVEACIRRTVEVGLQISFGRSCKRHVVDEILVRQHRPGRAGCVREGRAAVEIAVEVP